MKRSIFFAITIVLSAWGAPTTNSAEPRDQLRNFMRMKLKHSQEAIEGLVLEDFEKVATSAQELSLLSLAETWQVLNTPEYVDYSRKFRLSADALTEAAKKKNLDQATTAFNQVTTQCVNCHKYVRGVRTASVK
jgi:hypothetical protein